MGRRRWGLSGAAIVVALGLLTWGLAGTSGATDAGANRAAAQAEAARLVSLVQLPPGATRSQTEPAGDHGDLAVPGYGAATPNLVDASSWWTTSSSPSAVLSYLRAHRPAGASPWNTTGNSGANGAHVETFTLPPVTGVMSQRVIAVTATRLTNGVTGVRVDGATVWIVPRPAWEQIPATVTAVTFTARGSTRSGRLGHVSAPVRLSGATAQRLVRFINRLPIVQPGVSSCPEAFPNWLRMTFRGADGSVLATATERPTGCASVALAIGGRGGPALDDYPTVTSELVRLGVIPVCAGSQLAAASGAPGRNPSGQVLVLTFTNRSGRICRLGGFPRLRALDVRGHPLPLTVRRTASEPAVPLDPGGAAWTVITSGRCGAPRVARLRVTLPGVRPAFTLPVGSRATTFAPCHGRVTVNPLMPSF